MAYTTGPGLALTELTAEPFGKSLAVFQADLPLEILVALIANYDDRYTLAVLDAVDLLLELFYAVEGVVLCNAVDYQKAVAFPARPSRSQDTAETAQANDTHRIHWSRSAVYSSIGGSQQEQRGFMRRVGTAYLDLLYLKDRRWVGAGLFCDLQPFERVRTQYLNEARLVVHSRMLAVAVLDCRIVGLDEVVEAELKPARTGPSQLPDTQRVRTDARQ